MPISLNSRHKVGVFVTAIAVGVCLCLGASFRNACGAIIIGLALSWALGSNIRPLRWGIAVVSILIMLTPLLVAVVEHYRAVRAYGQSIANFRARLPALAEEHPDLAAGVVYLGPKTGEPISTPPITEWDAKGRPIRPSGGATESSGSGRPSGSGGAPPTPPPPRNDPYEALAALYGGVPQGDDKVDAFTRASRTLDIPNVGEIYFPSNVSAKDIAAAFRAARDHSQPPDWYFEALDAGIDPAQISYLSPPGDRPRPLEPWTAISDGALIELSSTALAFAFFGSFLLERRKVANSS